MPDNKSVFIFYNPESGRYSKHKIDKIYQETARYFHNCKLISDIEILKSVQNSHILVVGGDGTFHVAINNASIETNSFSIIPMGSGNDFASNFEKKEIKDLCGEIALSKFQMVDLIKVNHIYAHTICGVGFEALVAKKANESRSLFPVLKFILPVIRYLFTFKPPEIHIKGDQFEYKGQAFLASFGNGKRAGGGFRLFPRALMTDGLLDLLIITRPDFFQKLAYVWLVSFGKHLNLEVVKYHQLPSAQIACNNSFIFDADGEVYEADKLEITALKNKLRII